MWVSAGRGRRLRSEIHPQLCLPVSSAPGLTHSNHQKDPHVCAPAVSPSVPVVASSQGRGSGAGAAPQPAKPWTASGTLTPAAPRAGAPHNP